MNLIKRNQLKLIIPVVSIIVIIISIIVGFIIFSPTIGVEKYDSVEIDYTVWESDENEDYDSLNPILDTILWVSMIPITENSSTGIILGLYNNLLGKAQYYESGFIWLNRCIDEARDGIDDNTGKPALTYGNSADLYFDTCLMITFQVLNIQKSAASPQLTDIEKFFLFVIGIIFIAICIGAVGLLSGYYINKYRKSRKLRPKTVKERTYTRKDLLLKYGIMGSLLTLIIIIVLSSVHLYFPLQLILQYYPEVIWIIVILILVMWSLFIPFYLIIYKILKKRRA